MITSTCTFQREIFGTDLRNTVLRAALLLIMHCGQFIYVKVNWSRKGQLSEEVTDVLTPRTAVSFRVKQGVVRHLNENWLVSL